MSSSPPSAAILFEPDGYVLTGPKLMGRQAAGNAFLRAAVAGRGDAPLFAHTPHRTSAEIFGQLVQAMDEEATTKWIPADRLDLLAGVGTLYVPSPGLGAAARLRLHAGCSAYSLVGVTHTTASHVAMDAIVGMLSAPVMPWDALICTSQAVAGTVRVLLEAESETLRWQFGSGINLTLPELPVIPLGVHCSDFVFSPEERKAARQALGLGADEVVTLFVGRLSFHAKAHPHAMYVGLQAAAERTGKRVTLIQSGWFANDNIRQSFVAGAAQFAPEVKALFTDGKDAVIRRQSWAAADLFVSLSDNIQETFGLTPIEAMAAGLPVVVTDWDGYKDTVREGVDGFRIPTWMPSPGSGRGFAFAHEAGVENYEYYCGLTCQTVAVDQQKLVERLSDLIGNPALRLQLGEAGRARAREVFDWAIVFRQYQTLYARLAEIRRSAVQSPEWQTRLAAAPKVVASRMDPFKSFVHYPTNQINAQTFVTATPGATSTAYKHIAGQSLFSYADRVLPYPKGVEKLLAVLSQGKLDVQGLSEQIGSDPGATVIAVSVLAKMGLVRLSA